MGIFDFLQRKESATRRAMVVGQVGVAKQTARNYTAMANEGYKSNVVVYRAIQLISSCAAQVEWELYNGETEVVKSPLLDLIKRPNPTVGQKQFFENIYAFLLMSGNSYLELNSKSNMELWNVRPDYIKIIPGALGVPEGYEFNASHEAIVFPVDQITGRSAICHLKLFNPTDNWYGMSPMEAAFLSVDQHNNAGRWNLSLLQRDARPSGALMVEMNEVNPAGKLTAEQFDNMKAQIDELYSGAKNAGRPLLLEGGLSWQQMSMNAKDMDWLNAKNISAREIALALGVPPLLLNISGDNTYNNLKEARLAFYEETVIPLICHVRDELQRWLVPMFGDNLRLEYCAESIDGIILKRDMMFDIAIKGRDFLTVNEQRALVGYEPVEGGDDLGLGDSSAVDDAKPDAANPDKPEVQQEEEAADANHGNEGEAQTPKDKELQDVEKSLHVEDSLFDELKMVNLITRADKKRAARGMARRRDALAKSFEMDLDDEFNDMAKSMISITTNQQKIAEMQASAIIADHSDKFEKIFAKHIKRTALDFARPILMAAKSLAPNTETKRDEWFYSWLGTFVKTHTAKNVSAIQGTTVKKAREKIKDIVEQGILSGESNVNIGKFLQDELQGLSQGRAQLIARTEVAIASQTGSFEAAKATDIPGLQKEWVSIQDDRTRDGSTPGQADHLSMDGQKVALDDLFAVFIDGDSPTLMNGPGDPSAPASQLCSCRCALVFAAPRSR